jgi:acid phosphatase
MRFDNAFAITHPSQPNYIAILSGSTQGVTDDSCPRDFHGVENLPHQLIAAGLSFTGFSEDLPSPGYTGCSAGRYARKHNGWVDFDNVPAASNQPFTAFPSDFTALPSFAYVVPNLCNDMHDCSVSTGDTWVRDHLDAYAQWAMSHNSLLIVTLDEDSGTATNRIFTIFVGEHVRVGTADERIDHYSVLRTIEEAFGLPALANAAPITDIWH